MQDKESVVDAEDALAAPKTQEPGSDRPPKEPKDGGKGFAFKKMKTEKIKTNKKGEQCWRAEGNFSLSIAGNFF